MIQIADDYFLDRRYDLGSLPDHSQAQPDCIEPTLGDDCRPKVLIFPTNAVCNSFYRELRNPNFPNRYSGYLERGGFYDAKKVQLEGMASVTSRSTGSVVKLHVFVS